MPQRRSVSGTGRDPIIKFATLVIDEKEYKLAYSFNAIAEAESLAGCNLLTGIKNLTDLSAAQFRGLFYAALTVAQPKMALKDAGALIRFETQALIEAAIGEAYILSMPKQEDPDPNAEAPDGSVPAVRDN